MMKVLIVESEFLHQDTWVGNAVERLADALSQQNVTVIKSTSFDDGFAILSSNEAIDCPDVQLSNGTSGRTSKRQTIDR